jgi:PhoPQ-activated pathogenicity-related protein
VIAQENGRPARRLKLAVLAGGLALIASERGARADLDEYVKKPDPAFSWAQASNHQTPAGTIVSLKLTSQVWQGITWKHELTIYEPRELAFPDSMLLFITGGDQGSVPKDDDHKQGFGLARLCGARVAVLHQVPNQPLLDGKSEDELIAETFVRYLRTEDENWPLLFPMVKSAVRAMDALAAWSREHRRQDVKKFVVAGASKRGWTTWLTGAVDDRVVAIAPIVIVMLNMGNQGPNQLKVWGQYSEQIHDYVERGLMEKVQTPSGTKLWKMVDPYSYRDRLAKPKLLINGTNDRYWTLDALDLYWDGLKGPKYLVELPNAGHGLDQNRDWAISTLGAFFRHVVKGRPMPDLSWTFEAAKDGQFTLKVHASPAPREVRLWTARSASRDFRDARWESTPLGEGRAREALSRAEKDRPPAKSSPYVNDLTTTGWSITTRIPPPANGHEALFVELEFEVDGMPYHLTTTFVEPGIAPHKASE